MTRLTDSTLAHSSGANGSGANGSGSPLAGVPVADDRSIANAVRDGLSGKQVCPFCGSQNSVPASATTNAAGPCPRCTMEDTAATRQATKARIGPWHVLQTRNPAAPGMRYATLLALVGKSQVTARSVVRGPTTHQLWRYAAHVKGLSREFGICYSCGESIDKSAANCPHCDRAQEPLGNPDTLLESREPAIAAVASSSALVPAFASNEGSASDPYAIANRNVSSAPILSHAERLRTGNEIRRRPDGKAFSAMELAAALQVAPPPPAPESHPVRTVIITIAVVAVLASVIIGYFRPDLRRQAQDWSKSKWTQVEQSLASFHLLKQLPGDKPTPQTDADGSSNNPSVAPSLPNSSPADIGSVPANDNTNSSPTPSIQTTPGNLSGATGSPQPTSGAGDSSLTNPADAPDRGPSVADAASAPAARPSILPDQPVLVGTAPTSSEIWVLHSRGLDAEGRQDWAQAVHCYEQIELAPKDQWPTDVKNRLENAQRQLGK